MSQKKPLNIIFMGHVDAGKSTITGHLMALAGGIDERIVKASERDAERANLSSWKFAFLMDTSEEERAKGKTTECTHGLIETDSKKFILIDAPGHKGFVPNMISGATQADVGVLVISARRGELEAGINRGGQSTEHAVIAKTAGVRTLIVAINKMDDETVNYSKERFDECVQVTSKMLKSAGYNPKEVRFVPISGFTGGNLQEKFADGVCEWWTGGSLLENLDQLPIPNLDSDKPLRMSVNDRYKDMGLLLSGKIEQGRMRTGDKVIVAPTNTEVVVQEISIEEMGVEEALAGDNVFVKVKGGDEETIHVGDVVCSPDSVMEPVTEVVATVVTLDAWPNLASVGFTMIMHSHALQVEAKIKKIVAILDKRGKVAQKHPAFVKAGQRAAVRFELTRPSVLASFADFERMGRFILRSESSTVAVGVIKSVTKAN